VSLITLSTSGARRSVIVVLIATTWEGLKSTVPKALASVNLMTIRRFARRAQRYMSAYRNGLTLRAAEYAVKKYKSHRRIPDGVVLDVDE